jgi:hypothetical protein
MKRDLKTVLLTLAIVVGIATTIAAVPGIFSSVNSTSGYQVNSAAGSAGQALCSDGTFYDLPCSVAGSFTAAGDLSGSSSSQNVVGLQTKALPSLTAGFLNYNGSAFVYTPFTPRTCNGNGCYEVVNGVVHEWGVTASFDTGPSSVTLPFTMPAALESVEITQCYDSSGTGCSGASTVTRQWESGSWTTTGFSVRNDGAGQARWDAWGH